MVSLSIPGPLAAGRLIVRPNRFVVHVRLDADGATVRAHLPDPGRLVDILLPGQRLWLHRRPEPGRRTAWTALLAAAPEGGRICLDSQLPNRLVRRALEQQAIEELSDWRLERSEPRYGRSRFDFALRDASGRELLLEVKGVTLIDGEVARFPDAVTSRGTRHLVGLTERALAGGPSAVLFVVQRRARWLEAARQIDPRFADALEGAAAAGVRLLARRLHVDHSSARLGRSLPVVAAPAVGPGRC